MGKDNQLKSNRVGEVSYTKYGTKATIVEYINNKKVLVEFDDNFHYRYYTTYMNFKNGSMTNPYEKRSGNEIGYIGVGKYNSKNSPEAYYKWRAIIKRCYCKNYKDENNQSIASYEPCTVCEEWLCFQNFAEWYYSNCYECDEPLCVDKDILFHNNKEYSPTKCLLTPRRINLLFIKELGRRGDLPIGVQTHKQHSGYVVYISKDNKANYVGRFYDVQKAFETYKKEKEKYIKEVADSYKSVIPTKVYDAMYQYEILITD